MANNFNLGYDPLVANGILPMPIDYMVNNNIAPISALPVNNGIVNIKPDEFTSSCNSENKIPTWKKCLFAAVVATLAFFGLKKLGFKPFKKIAENKKIDGIKKFFLNKYCTVKTFLGNIFKKKTP